MIYPGSTAPVSDGSKDAGIFLKRLYPKYSRPPSVGAGERSTIISFLTTGGVCSPEATTIFVTFFVELSGAFVILVTGGGSGVVLPPSI